MILKLLVILKLSCLTFDFGTLWCKVEGNNNTSPSLTSNCILLSKFLRDIGTSIDHAEYINSLLLDKKYNNDSFEIDVLKLNDLKSNLR